MKTVLDLSDLVPTETTFKLSAFGDQKLVVKKWSLLMKDYFTKTYGHKELQRIFQEQDIVQIARVAYHMLTDDSKKMVGTSDQFLEAICSVQDQIAVMLAITGSIGIGEPEIKKITEAIEQQKKLAVEDPNAPGPNPNT